MDTLDNIKADARSILLEMKDIGESGPSVENAELMLSKMKELQSVADRLDSVPDDA